MGISKQTLNRKPKLVVDSNLGNPLREGLNDIRTPDPVTLVIFGITGDLVGRKLMSAIYNLATDNLLPHAYSVVGVGRRDWTDQVVRDEMSKHVHTALGNKINESFWKGFADSMFYVHTEYDDLEGYKRLAQRLDELDQQRGTQGNRLFYLAIPPDLYEQVTALLGQAGLNKSAGYTRIIVEKPFGKDLVSARALNQSLRGVYKEDQIYRIDHYLGKETVQNIAVFRFANAIFEPIWNRHYIDSVQITVAETVGVGTRGNYYDESGALRDILQNHVLQVLSLVAMEAPYAWEAPAIHGEKVKLLKSIRPIDPAEVDKFSVRGQYSDGSIEGEAVKGYLKTENVAPNSTTETYAALKLLIDNQRWAGVPFYLRTGKAMTKRVTEIAIQFHPAPQPLFG